MVEYSTQHKLLLMDYDVPRDARSSSKAGPMNSIRDGRSNWFLWSNECYVQKKEVQEKNFGYGYCRG